jgi:hypothetical protein
VTEIEDPSLSQNVISDETYRALIGWLKILVSPFLAFLLGIIGLRAYKRWEIKDLRPKIEMQDDVITRRFHLKDDDGEPVRVASSNAKPTERKLLLRTAPIGDAQNPCRIVEFED